jgi:hypothetical protein
MTEEQIKKTTFKLSFFDTFPVSEFEKINKCMKELGYEGQLVFNGNIVYTKEVKQP